MAFYCLSLGIGVIQGPNKLNVSGGNAYFGGTSSFQIFQHLIQIFILIIQVEYFKEQTLIIH